MDNQQPQITKKTRWYHYISVPVIWAIYTALIAVVAGISVHAIVRLFKLGWDICGLF